MNGVVRSGPGTLAKTSPPNHAGHDPEPAVEPVHMPSIMHLEPITVPRPVPTPVAAAIGIVPAVARHVRRLPVKAVQLPIYAVSSALTGLDNARRDYQSLAERGEALISRLRGEADEVAERVEDVLEDAADTLAATPGKLASTTASAKDAPLAARRAAATTARTVGAGLDRAADTVEDLSGAASGAAEQAGQVVEKVGGGAGQAVTDTAAAVGEAVGQTGEALGDVAGQAGAAAEQTGRALDQAAEAAEQAPVTVTSLSEDLAAEVQARLEDSTSDAGIDADNQDEAPKGHATPKATQPDDTRLDTAAAPDVVATVEQVSQAVGGEVLDHDELPLPDYDHMTLGSLRGRMRSLDVPQLVQIRDYEKAHADRLPIVTMLDNRIAKLASNPAAPLSGSNPQQTPRPASGGPRAPGGSKVSPATTGPKINPPPSGDPTNAG